MTNEELDSIIISTLAVIEPVDISDLEDDVQYAIDGVDIWHVSKIHQRIVYRTRDLSTQTRTKRAVLCFVSCDRNEPVVIRDDQ